MQFLNPDDHFVTIARADARAGDRRECHPSVSPWPDQAQEYRQGAPHAAPRPVPRHGKDMRDPAREKLIQTLAYETDAHKAALITDARRQFAKTVLGDEAHQSLRSMRLESGLSQENSDEHPD